MRFSSSRWADLCRSVISPLRGKKSKLRRRPQNDSFSPVAAEVEVLETRQLLSASLPVALPAAGHLVGTSEAGSGSGVSHAVVGQVVASSSHSGLSGSAGALTGAVSAFSFTATANSASQVTLRWNAAHGASSYVIDFWQNNAWHQIGSYNGSTTGVMVSGLSAGTTYYFDVGAISGSSVTWASLEGVTTLAAPNSLTMTATAKSSTQVNLSWTASSGATSYAIDEWVNGAWKQIGAVAAGTTSVSVNGLVAGTTYYFDVGASNSIGTTWATFQSVTTPSGSTNVTINEPVAVAAYTAVTGSLFGANGPQYSDVHQGIVGDCWLMASLAAVAERDPSAITNMFTSAGTAVENGVTVNLYKVRFYNSSGTAEYVIVDTELPAGGADYDHVNGGPLWVALAEKAYAEANGMGYVTTGALGQNSYAALSEGQASWALQAITGLSASYFAINPANIAAAWNSGKIIVLASSPNANDNLIVGDSNGTHAYAVIGYNASSSSPFELYNPWGESTTVNGTIPYNGKTVYGGAFYANSSLISSDFVSGYAGAQVLVYGGQANDADATGHLVARQPR